MKISGNIWLVVTGVIAKIFPGLLEKIISFRGKLEEGVDRHCLLGFQQFFTARY
jgi:hypothetical protein